MSKEVFKSRTSAEINLNDELMGQVLEVVN